MQFLLPSILQIFDDKPSTEARREEGKRWDSSRWIYGFMIEWHQVPRGHTITLRNTVVHGRRKQRSWAPSLGSWRTVCGADQLRVLSGRHELGSYALDGLIQVGVLDSPFRPHLDADLFIDSYSVLALVSWGLLNTTTLFQQAAGAWGSPALV
jgi:hypothetical protein